MIKINNLKKAYTTPTQKLEVLKGIDIHIKAGELVSIMGPSGSGKSTLMNSLGCLDTPTKGQYILNNQDVSKLTDNEFCI